MSRRPRPDAFSLGRSRRAPFVRGETPPERHARRLRVALGMRQVLEDWLAARGLALVVGNDGQHWQVLREGRQVLEWWPSSAKAVVAKRWSRGAHVHDADQLRELICRVGLDRTAFAAGETS